MELYPANYGDKAIRRLPKPLMLSVSEEITKEVNQEETKKLKENTKKKRGDAD